MPAEPDSARTRPKRTKTLAFRVLLALAVVVATVVTSEIAYRTANRYVCAGRGFVGFVPDARFGWTHEPDSGGWTYGCNGRDFEFRVHVRTNSMGLRDDEHTHARIAGTARVLVLGDSVTEAYQVEQEQTYPELLERELSAHGKPVEVINAGHAAFGTDNQVLFYESEGVRYSPDVVVSQFNLQNDVAENSPILFVRESGSISNLPKADISIGPDGQVELGTGPFRKFEENFARRAGDWGERLQNELFVLRLAGRLLASAPQTPAAAANWGCPAHVEDFVEPPAAEWKEAWELTRALYARLDRSVRASGARLFVVVVPTRESIVASSRTSTSRCFAATPDVQVDFDAPTRRAHAMLDALGIGYVDATPAFQACQQKGDGRCYFQFDPHPDVEGQRTLANVLCTPLGAMLQTGDCDLR